jgi:probable HAF family extracellular repeat protein
MRTFTAIGLAAVMLALTPAPQAQNAITMTDLGTLGGNYAAARAINGAGQVVGNSELAPDNTEYHAFLWSDGVMQDLGNLCHGTCSGSRLSMATDINDAGQVTGWSYTPTGDTQAFIWQNGTMTALPMAGFTKSSATGINNQGQIAGQACTGPGIDGCRAVLWENAASAPIVLGVLNPALPYSTATDVNEGGRVVGQSRVAINAASGFHEFHGFVWDADTGMVDLGVVDSNSALNRNHASGINDTGTIAGNAYVGNFIERGVTWSGGVPQLLPTFLPDNGSIRTYVSAINNADVVVGATPDTCGEYQAVMWANGAVTPLGGFARNNAPAGCHLSWAYGLNDRGQIVGQSLYSPPNSSDPSQWRAVLWTTTPPQSETTTTIAASPVTYGSNAEVTVTVSASAGGPASGSVSLSVDGGTPQDQALVNGVATFVVPNPTGGSHSLSALYAEQGAFLESSGGGTLIVHRAAATIAVTGYSGTFDGAAHGAAGSATGVHGESLTVLLNAGASFTNVPGGTAQWTFTGDGNYEPASGTVSIAIQPAPLTVTAQDAAIILGAPLPAFGVTYSGFAGSDGPSSLAGTLAFSTEATSAGPVGTYAVVPGGLASSNYAIGFVSGTVLVTYNVCPSYDQDVAHRRGSTIPIRIALCDAGGNAIPAMGIVVQATGGAVAAGNANPGEVFRHVGGNEFLFTLQASGIAPGVHWLTFKASGDPVPHAVRFTVR